MPNLPNKGILIIAVIFYNPWNDDAEAGDIMVDNLSGQAYRLYERKGKGIRVSWMAARGELSMYPLKKKGHRATIKDGCLVWMPEEEFITSRNNQGLSYDY